MLLEAKKLKKCKLTLLPPPKNKHRDGSKHRHQKNCSYFSYDLLL